MSMTIDSLELEVQHKSSDASNSIDSLTQSLSNLKSVAKGGVGLTTVSNQLTRIKTALGNMDNLKNISRLTTELSKLQDVRKASGLSSIFNQLKKLPEINKGLDTQQISTFAKKITELTAAVKPLATEMDKINLGFSRLPANIQRAINANAKMNKSTTNTTRSFIGFATGLMSKVYAVQRLLGVVGEWIGLSNDYQENLNLFAVAQGEYYEQSLSYAKRVQDAMGIDMSEWIRYQAVFQNMAEGFGIISSKAEIMSRNLVQMGYDLASVFNVKFDTAMEKLESALSGQPRPMREWGFDLSESSLKQISSDLGITKNVEKMSQMEKAQLRYIQLFNTMNKLKLSGDLARTIETPANALRVLVSNARLAARELGNIFIPALNKVLPYAIAFLKVIRYVATEIASFFGFEFTEVDYSGLQNAVTGLDDVADATSGIKDNTEGATKAAKELKNAVMGFDELNIIDPTADTSASGSSASAGGGPAIDLDLPDNTNWLEDAVASKADGILSKLKLVFDDVFFEWGDKLNSENILEKIVVGLSAIGGAVVGFTLGGFKGAVLGAIIGTALGLTFNSIVFNNNGKIDAGEIFSVIKGVLASAVGGFVGFTIGGAAGAAIGLTIGFSLTLLAETINMKADSSTAKNFENAFTSLIPTGLAVGIGVKFGTKLLEGFDDVFSAGGGVKKALKNGLSNVSNSLTPIQSKLMGIAGVVGGFVSTFTGVKNLVGDIAGGTSTWQDIVSDSIPVVMGLAGAFTAVSIAFNSTGIGLLVTGIVAVAAAVPGIIKGFQELGENMYLETDDFAVMEGIITRSTTALDNCNIAIENMRNGIAGIDDVSTEFAMAGTLVDEIMDINENADASAYELGLMETKVDILNGMNIKGLSLSIDETTGRVIQTREETNKLIATLEKEAQMEAMRGLLVQSYKDQFQALADATQAAKDYDAANEALKKTSDELAECPWYDPSRRATLKEAQEKETEAVKKAKEAYDKSIETYNTLDGTIDTYTGALADMKAEEIGTGDELCNGLDKMKAALDETALGMPDRGKDIADGLTNGVNDNIKESVFAQIFGKIISVIRNVFDMHSPSQLMWNEGKNIADGAKNGVSDNILESDFEGIFGRIATAFQTGIQGIPGIMKTVFTNAVNTGISIFNSFIDWVNEKMKISWDAVKIGKKTIIPAKSFQLFTIPHIPEIKQKANGGYVSSGELFIANEAGPELIGRIGNNTAVANNMQIISGISAGVKSAIAPFANREISVFSRFFVDSNKNIADVGNAITREMKEFEGVSYNPNIDYMALINEAKALGDTDRAKELEKVRNAKIFGENLTQWEPTYEFNEALVPLTDEIDLLSEDIFANSDLAEEYYNDDINYQKDIVSNLEGIRADLAEIRTNMRLSVSDATSRIVSAISQIKINIFRASSALKFASGGFPEMGQLFIAREAGPELVGKMGSKNVVANNAQIVQGVADGVYDAVVSAMAQSEPRGTDLSLAVYLDGKQINASVKKVEKESGAKIATGGVISG